VRFSLLCSIDASSWTDGPRKCFCGMSFEIVPPVAGVVRSAPLALSIPVQPSEYDKLDRMEDQMWWFAALHANLLLAASQSQLDELDLPILDAGCGTGGFLSRLARNSCSKPVIGLDLDFRACQRAAVKSARPVCAGSINDLPFADAALAGIFSADVLCHEGVDECRALRQFYRCLCPSGWLILNLPAYQWMLSWHDAAVSNIRRYTVTSLRHLLKAVGFHPVYMSYWNAMLFPLMVIKRKLIPARHGAVSDVKPYSHPAEVVCRAAVAFEAALLQRGVRLPFGGSILAVAVKRSNNRD
jgi:SAM-dependent methyltransferase